ncbi:cell wall hydrolase [Bacillus mycoides]|nr:cell wall hydrolase [Bacillus mycoides]QWH03773.1 cell wall hydrolase [Bacillus mycoides]
MQAMAERGIKGRVNVDSLSGLCYIQTDVLPNTELDKITWWVDT